MDNSAYIQVHIHKVGRGTRPTRLEQVGRVAEDSLHHLPSSKEVAMDVILLQELARSDVCCMEQTKPEPICTYPYGRRQSL
jgi:hypothetical protein